MNRFQQVGVWLQAGAGSKAQAQKRFVDSCLKCCYRGMQSDCDNCPIAAKHEEVLGIFDAIIGDRKERNRV